MAETAKQVHPLDLPDDKLDEFDWDNFVAETEEDDKEGTEEEESEAPEEKSEENTESTEDKENTSEENEEEESLEVKENDTAEASTPTEEESTEETSEAKAKDVDAGDSDEEGVEDEVKKDKESKDSSDKDTDYKGEYYKILAPFKANNRMMQVENIEDARTLMQMGANYNKKMAALKPSLQIVKTLEQNDLLDPEKVNYLIDLSKKQPDAVKKFIQDSGIDPMDIDNKEKIDYKPSNYIISDTEITIDTVLESIADTKSYRKTLDILGNVWDSESRKVLINEPAMIPILNRQVEIGVYDQISSIVERERALGRLIGLSDFQAYKQVGDDLFAQGKMIGQQQPSKEESTSAGKSVKTDPKLKDKKKAASSTKSTAKKTKVSSDFNPLNIPDEEFEKMVLPKFV